MYPTRYSSMGRRVQGSIIKSSTLSTIPTYNITQHLQSIHDDVVENKHDSYKDILVVNISHDWSMTDLLRELYWHENFIQAWLIVTLQTLTLLGTKIAHVVSVILSFSVWALFPTPLRQWGNMQARLRELWIRLRVRASLYGNYLSGRYVENEMQSCSHLSRVPKNFRQM